MDRYLVDGKPIKLELMHNNFQTKDGPMPTITEFLEARIEEDEARASSGWSRLGDSRWETTNYGQDFLTPSAVLAECAAKRGILAAHPVTMQLWWEEQCEIDVCSTCQEDSYPDRWPCPTIQALAAIYKDHADYDSRWAAS